MSEEWRVIADFPAYEVSDQGRVRRRLPGINGAHVVVGRILPRHRNPNENNFSVRLQSPKGRQTVRHVTQLVARTFLTMPENRGARVRNKDGDPANCAASNLEWTLQRPKGPVLRKRGRRIHTNHNVSYFTVVNPEHPNSNKGGIVSEHVAVAAAALGKALPKGCHVHHVNGNGLDNRPRNLVICQDNAYHKLLHRRQRALDACGHAGWICCRYCGVWGAPESMTPIKGTRGQHRACHAAHWRTKNQARSA